MIRNRLGASARGTPRVPSAVSASAAAAYYQANDLNTVLTAADVNMQVVDTANYSETVASPAWAFTALGCIAAYVGEAGKTFLVTSIFTVIPLVAIAGTLGFSAAIALNADVIGQNPATLFTGGVIRFDSPSSSQWKAFSCQRIVQPSVGDVVQPCFALFEDRDTSIIKHTVTIIDVG